MTQLLKELGFTIMDGFILLSCIGAAIVGSLVDYTIKRENFLVIKAKADVELTFSRYAPIMIGRVFVGGVAGLLVYLLLLGSITSDMSGYARLLILSGVAGFSAPTLLNKYENKIPTMITGVIPEAGETANKPSNSDAGDGAGS